MKRPYHHGDLRSALLKTAEQVVEVRGTAELSLRELSRETGVSNTAPRRHFSNKQALLDALAVEGFERLGAVLNEALADGSKPFDTRLVQLARAHVRFALQHPAMLRLMFAAKHHREASPALLEASHRALSAGPLTVMEGQAAGAVVPGDADQLALTVFAAVDGLVNLSTEGEFGGVPLDRLVVEIVRQIIVGLRPRG